MLLRAYIACSFINNNDETHIDFTASKINFTSSKLLPRDLTQYVNLFHIFKIIEYFSQIT